MLDVNKLNDPLIYKFVSTNMLMKLRLKPDISTIEDKISTKNEEESVSDEQQLESDSDEDDNDVYSSDSSSSFHYAMTNDILYLRDSSSWVFPDVTSQLTKQAQQWKGYVIYSHGSSKNNCLTLCQVRRSRTTTIL